MSAQGRPIGGPAARERLAADQAALVRALVGGGPAPGGFDPGRAAATLAGPPRRLVVTVRAPGLGEHWLTVPFG